MRKVLYLLGELNDADVEWLIATGSRRQLAAGEMLIEEGRPATALYIVLDGQLSATVAALQNKEVERLTCGAVVGEMSLVDGMPPSATVRARETALVLAVPRAALSTRLQMDTGFAARFYKAIAIFLSDRLRGKIQMLGGVSVDQLAEDIVADDEIDPNTMDTLVLAGARFDRMLRRLIN